MKFYASLRSFSLLLSFFSGFSDYALTTCIVTTFVCSVLSRESRAQAEALIQLRCVHSLMVAMGNTDYADSQRQAAITLAVGFFRPPLLIRKYTLLFCAVSVFLSFLSDRRRALSRSDG